MEDMNGVYARKQDSSSGSLVYENVASHWYFVFDKMGEWRILNTKRECVFVQRTTSLVPGDGFDKWGLCVGETQGGLARDYFDEVPWLVIHMGDESTATAAERDARKRHEKILRIRENHRVLDDYRRKLVQKAEKLVLEKDSSQQLRDWAEDLRQHREEDQKLLLAAVLTTLGSQERRSKNRDAAKVLIDEACNLTTFYASPFLERVKLQLENVTNTSTFETIEADIERALAIDRDDSGARRVLLDFIAIKARTPAEDAYLVLDVPRDFDVPELLKRQYRLKSRDAHPDAGGSDTKFQRVSQAYAVLSDPEKRKAYDNDPLFNFNVTDIYYPDRKAFELFGTDYLREKEWARHVRETRANQNTASTRGLPTNTEDHSLLFAYQQQQQRHQRAQEEERAFQRRQRQAREQAAIDAEQDRKEQLPNGTYKETCTGCQVTGSLLSCAKCPIGGAEVSSGSYRVPKIHLSTCADDKDNIRVANRDGWLVCDVCDDSSSSSDGAGDNNREEADTKKEPLHHEEL